MFLKLTIERVRSPRRSHRSLIVVSPTRDITNAPTHFTLIGEGRGEERGERGGERGDRWRGEERGEERGGVGGGEEGCYD